MKFLVSWITLLTVPAIASSQGRLLLAGHVPIRASVTVTKSPDNKQLTLLQQKNTPFLNFKVTLSERKQAIARRTETFSYVINDLRVQKVIKKLSASTYVIAIESP